MAVLDVAPLLAVGREISEKAPRAVALVSLAVRKTAHDIEADAKALAPVDTGFLRGSISTTVSRSLVDTTAEIGPTASYGIYQELGTSKMAPQPFLAPAFDRRVDGFADAIGKIAAEDVL